MIAKTERRQYLATFILNLLPFTYGGAVGWVSPALLELTSKTNPLFPIGPITSIDASWIGSTISLGAIGGTILFGFLVDRIGRKFCLMMTAIPLIINWILKTVAQDVLTLCVARFVCGLGVGGIFVLNPMFISEIADDRIRGTLATSIVLSVNAGVLGMFVLGTFFSYQVYSAVFLIFPTIFFFIVLFYLPETPQRLIAVNKFAEAEKSLQFYHNDKNYRLPEDVKQPAVLENLDLSSDDTSSVDSKEHRTLLDDLKTRAVQKAFLIGTVIMWFNQFCGLFTMMTFAGMIFQEAGSSLSPNVSSIVVAIIQMLGSYCSTIFVDRFGRKILLAGSGIGIALGLTGLGFYIFCKVELMMNMESISWISLLCFCFSIFIGNCGIMAMPFVIVSDIFPSRISRLASSYCMLVLHLLCFLAVKYFVVISDAVGPQYCFFFFGICSFIGAMFSMLCMPETKGKSFEEIEKLLSE